MSAGLRVQHQLVPLLAAAQEAERIARDIAAAQAGIAPVAALQRALTQQSRQEAVHAAVFASALACLPGRAACPPRLARALARFRQRLQADVAAGRLAASLFGLQHVLEALGHVALQPPHGELAGLGDQFVPLRGLLAKHWATGGWARCGCRGWQCRWSRSRGVRCGMGVGATLSWLTKPWMRDWTPAPALPTTGSITRKPRRTVLTGCSNNWRRRCVSLRRPTWSGSSGSSGSTGAGMAEPGEVTVNRSLKNDGA